MNLVTKIKTAVTVIDFNQWLDKASKVSHLPLIDIISPRANQELTRHKMLCYLKAQELALGAAQEIASFLKPGWTEKQAAELLNTYLQDNGVNDFFHFGFTWFGERSRFDGIKTYYDFLPSDRVVNENEVFILDVAPIVDGYICDIGYSGCLGHNDEYEKAKIFLADLREEIPKLFLQYRQGQKIWQIIDQKICDAGYDNIHKLYPFSVLGHRVHQVPKINVPLKLLNFSWKSYWALLSRGLFGQLLNQHFLGDLIGLWAIEPHIGTKSFGIKFEEILVVERDKVFWLADLE